MSQQHQSQGSCEVRGWPGPMSLRSPAPAEGGLTLLPLSPADCKPPPGHERGAGELLRISACLLASLTHPPVNEIQRGKARQNTTSWEPRGLSPQPGEVPVVADANQLPPQECAHRGMEMKNTRGKNFPFYSPFAPGEREPPGRHLSPSSAALLPPRSRTKNNTASSHLCCAGEELCGAGTPSHQHSIWATTSR